MDAHEYFGLCADHDWYFSMSDNNTIYHKGLDEHNLLMWHYKQDEKYKKMFNAWCDYIKYDGSQPEFDVFK